MSLFATGVESVKHEYPPDFEAAYASYPRHVGKGDALKAWAKAVKAAITLSDQPESVKQDALLAIDLCPQGESP